MKKVFTATIFLISVLLLAACSNATGEDNNTDTQIKPIRKRKAKSQRQVQQVKKSSQPKLRPT